jgi:hypothetical protein
VTREAQGRTIKERSLMRRTLSLLASTAVLGGLYAALAVSPAAADLGCPDGMTPVPAAFVHNGDNKDQNENTFVCAKPTACGPFPGADPCRGGPDDDVFGHALRGDDDLWYYVTDDV